MSPNQELAPPSGLIVIIHHSYRGAWSDSWTVEDRIFADAEDAADVVVEAVRDMELEGELRSCNRAEQHVRVVSVTGQDHTSETLDIVAARLIFHAEDGEELADWITARANRVKPQVEQLEAAWTARLEAALARASAA